MKRRLLFLLFFCSLFYQLHASEHRQVIRQVSSDFFTIDKTSQKSIPLFFEDRANKCYIILNLEDNKNFDLSFVTTTNLCVFINNTLFFKSQYSDSLVHLPAASIAHQFNQKQVVVTFYSPFVEFNHQQVAITQKREIKTNQDKNIIQRKASRHTNTPVFLLLIVAILGLVKNKDTVIWKSYFNFSKLLSTRPQADEYVLRSVLSTESLMLISLLSVLIACVLNEFNLILVEFNLAFLPKQLLHVLLVFVLLLLKYVFLQLISTFLNISSFGTQQFYEFIRYLIWLSFIHLVLILVFKDNFHSFSKPLLWVGVVLWNIKILTVALSKLRFQKVYLFSYICASELIPAIVLINFIETIN